MPFTLARVALDSPVTFSEQLGDPVTNTGGSPVPAVRSAIRHAVDLPTFTSPITTDTVERRMRARRQLRSMLNNAAYKMAGLYLNWEDDTEQNGWYIPDQGQMVAGADASLTHGWFNLANFAWFKLGASRTHRQAIAVSMKNLTTGLQARDSLRRVYSTDFSALTPFAITYIHAGATDVANAASGDTVSLNLVSPPSLPVGRDGGANKYVIHQEDGAVLSFDCPDTSRNLGDVLAYDQRGLAGLPVKGEDPQSFGWEEIYGPDYPYTAGSVPVLDNGLVRVLFDSTHMLGFRVFVWNGTEYLEQGKMAFVDGAPAAAQVRNLTSASIREYTPERVVLQVNVTAGLAFLNRGVILITLQRGWSGPRFEYYPGAQGGVSYTASLKWVQVAIGENTSALKQDTIGAHESAVDVSTAGTGSTSYSAQIIGATSFPGQNVVAVLRQGAAFQQMLAVVQAGAQAAVETDVELYGTLTNAITISSGTNVGYVSARLAFAPQQTDQIMEAEAMTLATGTASTIDAAASNGKAATATRTADALHTSKAEWPNKDRAVYRIMARCKITGGAGTLNIYAKTTNTTGSTALSSAASYVWVDLGDVETTGETLEVHAWSSGGVELPALAVTDAFGRAAPLGANWTLITGAGEIGTISSEKWSAAAAFPTTAGSRWNVAEQTNPAVSIEFVTAASALRWFGLWACLAAATKSGYFVRWEEIATGKFTVTIERWALGSKVVLMTFTEVALATTNSVGITVRGGFVTAWRKVAGTWSMLGQIKDATYTKGYSGIEASGSNTKLDNFSTGEALAVTPTIAVDRLESFLAEDQVFESGGTCSGYRDVGLATLMDSRAEPTVVTRS